MNPPTGDELDDIHFLVAAQNTFSTTAAARCHPGAATNPAHDADMRLLDRWHADGNALWKEGPHGVSLTTGWLLIDDATLDKILSKTWGIPSSSLRYRVKPALDFVPPPSGGAFQATACGTG